MFLISIHDHGASKEKVNRHTPAENANTINIKPLHYYYELFFLLLCWW